jgi:predicted SAM-dependent methyltransferase
MGNSMKLIAKKVLLILLAMTSKLKLSHKQATKLNLCSGNQEILGYISADYNFVADLTINLNRGNLPFRSHSLEVVTCISAINYFTRKRGQEIVDEVYRALARGGVARFASQDLEWIAKRYIEKDRDFFFQKLPNGNVRFEGKTMGDKFNSWFYGYETIGGSSKYFYDYETLEDLFITAGFSVVEKREYMDSRIEEIEQIDNRKNQMFFLEAVK